MSDQYSGNTIGGTYRSKRSNVLIDIRQALRELDTLGTTIDQLEESKEVFSKIISLNRRHDSTIPSPANLDVVRKQFDVVRKKMIASEKTCSELGEHFTVHNGSANDGLITMKKNIDKQDVIEEAIEAIEFSEDPIEILTQDYSSEEKKESRSYAYHRLDANGKPITKAINAGLFIVHDKLMDIVQAWNEGLIDKHTQLVLVSVGSVEENGEKIKVVDILSSNFDLILENTTKEMGYDSVPSFDKSPRFWHKSIHTLKENSKCDYNENGFVWSDLKGKIQYAFLDYCGNNNFKYMNWYEQVLYPMMSNTAHVAINHFSYVRGNSSWRDICKKFLDACYETTNAIGCYRWLQKNGKMDDFKSRYEDGLYAINEAYGHDDIEHSVIQLLGFHSIELGTRCTHEIIDRVCKKNPNLMMDGSGPAIDRLDDDAWSTYLSTTSDNEVAQLHALNSAYGSLSLEASHKTEHAIEHFDSALIASAFWKATYLDHKNPQAFVTTPQAAEAVREITKNIKNNKPRFSNSWKDVQDTHDNMHPYDMDRYEYQGSQGSSKMVIHKFIVFKQAPKFKHKPNLSLDHPRQTSTLKGMLEYSTIYERFSPHSMMLLNIEETAADEAGTATNFIFDEDGSIMFEGLNLHQSNRFSDEYCVKDAARRMSHASSLSGCVRGIVQCFDIDLFSEEMDEHMNNWKHIPALQGLTSSGLATPTMECFADVLALPTCTEVLHDGES